jgi:hypothetical protein
VGDRIRQDRDADRETFESVHDPTPVTEHPLGQIIVALGLDFGMDEKQFAAGIPAPDLDKFVDPHEAGLGIGNKLLKFGVEKADRDGPVNGGGNVGKGEGEEVG